jgi:hypothetical protein
MGVEKTTKRGALCFLVLNKYNSGDKIKKTKMCRTCMRERRINYFGGEI